MKKQFDPTKPVQTVSGEPVTILTHEREGQFPIVALVGAAQDVVTYTSNGWYYLTGAPSGKDLVNVPQKHKLRVWVNIYPGDLWRPGCHFSKEIADNRASVHRVACICLDLEYEEGEGL